MEGQCADDAKVKVMVWALVMFLLEPVSGTVQCMKHDCGASISTVKCRSGGNSTSRLLISDVTDYNLRRMASVLAKVKATCMGRSNCDLDKICGGRENIVIHYFCIHGSEIKSSSCSRKSHRVMDLSGYILSPGYPVKSRKTPCRWQIQPPPNSSVVITLHDVSTKRGGCDGGLKVRGTACGEGQDFVPTMLCGKLRQVDVPCGQVDIELTSSLRFWLSFQVYSRETPQTLKASLLPCSGWVHTAGMGTRYRNLDYNHTDQSTHSLLASTGEGE